jgi:selenocysteine-specific elongation factor
VAADEGWKPQSEEHLAIVDVLGAHGGVVALTKRDLVDAETLAIARDEVRERLAGTTLEGAPIVPCSSATGEGIDHLRTALDAMVAAAPPPERDARPRWFIDRVFSIKGAGTVATGTLTGGPLSVGDEVQVYPNGPRARIRGLQSHRRTIEVAEPVSRVAGNLVGVDREQLERGDVLGFPGQWRATALIEARVRPVRGLSHPLRARGAYKVYAGSAERDAALRWVGGDAEVSGREGAFARIRLSSPAVLQVGDRFVLRESGRRETVAGGIVLDVDPPRRPGPGAAERLGRREAASPDELPAIVVAERGAVAAADLPDLTGVAVERVPGAVRVGDRWIAERLHDEAAGAVIDALERFHAANPLLEGAELQAIRAVAGEAMRAAGARPAGPGLVDALLADLEAGGRIARTGSTVRLTTHRVALDEHEEEVAALVAAVRDGEPTPPTVRQLTDRGFDPVVLDAAARAGRLVRVGPDLLMTPELVSRAAALIGAAGAGGITVSELREALGTSRRFAVPLVEHLDRQGVTVRRGDRRVLRGA